MESVNNCIGFAIDQNEPQLQFDKNVAYANAHFWMTIKLGNWKSYLDNLLLAGYRMA